MIERNCEICGKPLLVKKRGRHRKYCSDRCRKTKYDLECIVCGGPVCGTTPSKMFDIATPVCIKCAPTYYKTWSKDKILESIRAWSATHGGAVPSANSFHKARAGDVEVPTVNCVQGYFGSWNAAIRAAGFEPRNAGMHKGGKHLTPAQREECVRRYIAGESSPVIAADFGCSPATVTKWARRVGVPIRETFGNRKTTQKENDDYNTTASCS